MSVSFLITSGTGLRLCYIGHSSLSNVAHTSQYLSTASDCRINIHAHFSLLANETFNVQIYQSSGGSLNIDPVSYFTMCSIFVG